ncbi:unnamed protein product [Vitrella brassicaformis CCMP3155]|uniref:D-arabinitol 2-dehydrogenase [ribulose-forming] n=1 Tax=Vitrella brassicaformis (strain CCMP3155) TaxID=1169540 RepID=A0A0G4F221_VITBC|nr:unnamed protein product [Vitrella brassicaformis CCMP3155]|mmetsp:Transcript_42258/g.105511  ORF Transcript_42258/g.105511 Transcript_42258/m.105511 type:complete len:557 (-) Transcript_42258:786-2456(-)|eukprot:CEM05799.1 unnamed protein product [Vitrella brassicaformis CCMP3155]
MPAVKRHEEMNGMNGDINATGQPDTPMEVATFLLKAALETPDSDVAKVKEHVKDALGIVRGLDPYLEQVSTPASDVAQKIWQDSVVHPWSEVYMAGKTQFKLKKEMVTNQHEGVVLKMLVKLMRAKRVLEIGMFTGFGALCMAEGVPDDGQVVTCEIEPYLKDFVQQRIAGSPHGKKIRIELGDAAKTLKELDVSTRDKKFDFVFMDADKVGYTVYWDLLIDRDMVAPGGVIGIDNSLMKGRVYSDYNADDVGGSAIREFNKKVRSDPRFEMVMLPVRDGLTLVRREPTELVGDAVMQAPSVFDRLSLRGKVALVTGGGQGIGRAYAHALADAGASVCLIDLDGGKAADVAGELMKKGVGALALQADVTKAEDTERCIGKIVETFGHLDVAINNAGMNKNSDSIDTSREEWQATFKLNTESTFFWCQAEAKQMMKQGGGKIINTASMAATWVPHPQNQTAYNASKAAVLQLSKTLASEWAKKNIQVNCISPGIVRSALIENSEALRPLVSLWYEQNPQGKLCEFTDLQGAVLLLASSASDHITGINLTIDGGHTLW